MKQFTYDLRGISDQLLDELVTKVLPLYLANYPRATADLLRHSMFDAKAAINQLRVYCDDDGKTIGYNILVLRSNIEIGGKHYAVFRDETAVHPSHRGKIPVTRDFARESALFMIKHPLTPTVYFGAGSLSGYHFVLRNSYIAYPSPWRTTPPEIQEVMVELGRIFFDDEPGSIRTDNPLVLGNELLDAPHDQEMWLQSHRDFYPELTEYYLRMTGGRTDRFVLFLVPGSWKNLIMTTIDDRIKRSRRAWRRRAHMNR